MRADELTVDLVLALRQRSERDRRGWFFAEGVRFLVAAVDAGAHVEALVVAPRMLVSPIGQMIVRRLKRAGVPALHLPPDDFARISLLSEPQGVGAVFRQRRASLDDLAHPSRDALWVLLEEAHSPGNVGSLLRTCDAVGAHGLILTSEAVDPFDPATIRATMGSLFRQRLVRTSPRNLASVNRCGEYLVVGATPEGTRDYRTIQYRRPVWIVLGNERCGLSDAQRTLCDELVRIPMRGRCDSLNLAVATSVLLYEVFGQRHPARRWRG